MNKELIKSLAPKVTNISFDIDFFEYSEKRGYTANNNMFIKPEIEKGHNRECKEEHELLKKKIEVSEDNGILCNVEIIKRYINIEDVSVIKNNNFYYNIVERIEEDNRIKINSGIILNLTESNFFIRKDKYIINEEAYEAVIDIFKNSCEIKCIAYKISCDKQINNVYKVIAIYIE